MYLVTPHCVTKNVRTSPPPIPHPPFIPLQQNMTLLSITYKLEEGKEGIGKNREENEKGGTHQL